MEILKFALLGLGAGGAYALAAQGIVLIYKGSGTVNFAHGALGMVAGFVVYEEMAEADLPVGLMMLVGVLVGGVLGILEYVLVLRALRRSSALTRLIATLGVLLLVQALATLRFGGENRIVSTPFPSESVELTSDVTIPLDRIVLFAVAVVVTILLWAVHRFTLFGKATAAAAENETSVAALGWSPDRLALVNWAAGGCLAGLAGVLIVPISGLQVSTLTLLVIVAIAAALVGGFRSFGWALAGGVAIGVAESEISRYSTSIPGAGRAVPLLFIVGVLVLSGRSLPLRGYLSDRLPSVGSGKAPLALVVGAPLVIVAVVWSGLPVDWLDAITTTLIVAVLLLSIVVVTGYAGQVSLAQYSLAGTGAFVAGRLVSESDAPFELAVVAALLVAVPVGALFALPAVRTRGVSLAIVTLALGVALHSLIFTNYEWTGGLDGTAVGETHLLGVNIDSVRHPERYASLVLLVLVLAALAVSRIRRSALGHRMLALRGDERAAAALGVNIAWTKVEAFTISSAIAALAGVLMGFRSRSIVYGNFDVFSSIFALAFAVIGGVGYISGALIGSVFASGGVGSQLLDELGGAGRYVELVGAAVLVVNLLAQPDGIASLSKLVKPFGRRATGTATEEPAPARVEAVATADATLRVDGVSVSYGGVDAVRDVSLHARPGEIVGLIGPNGAGKTSLIDAISGFTPVARGSVHLGGVDLTRRTPHRRARLGLSRSFQGIGVFDDLTVQENVQVAAWASGARAALRSFVRPDARRMDGGGMAWACLAEFGLRAADPRTSGTLPLAQRRICGLARSLGTTPTVLMLDEPAAGLDDAEVEELRLVLRALARDWKVAVLLVEHHVGLVMSLCDRIYVLESGSLLSEGSAAEVASDPEVVSAYLGSESQIEGLEHAVPAPRGVTAVRDAG